MAKRNLVLIDEDKCTGCGQCVTGCHEGALQIVDGKAKLISEIYCDGLGACIGECPEGAITVEEREAVEFDQTAVDKHLAAKKHSAEAGHVCPGSAMKMIRDKATKAAGGDSGPVASELAHWPVQLTLVPPSAPYLKDADVLLTADCVPFAMGDFHRKLLRDHMVLVACPKLDNTEAHTEKLTSIIKESGLKSLSVIHMEVPCCFGLQKIGEEAVKRSNRDIPFQEIVIGVNGEVK